MMYYRTLRNRGKKSGYFSGPRIYKLAFGISVLLHGLFFLLMALLINPFENSRSYETPLVIDFLSVAGIKNQQVFNHNGKENINQIAQSKTLVNSELQFKESTNFIEETNVQSRDNDNFSIEPDHTSGIPESKEQSKLAQPFFASVLIPNSLKLPRFDIAEPKLLPARMSISERHEKTLPKKLKTLAEKLHKMNLPDSTIIVEDKRKKFEVKIQHLPAQSSTGLDEVKFEITTEENGKILSTEMRMRRLAFSSFAQLVDFWDPQVAIHDDKLEGRFHTNYAFAISRSNGIGPKFHGKVTTAAYEVKKTGDFPIIDEASIFVGGIETGVKEIQLPKTFSLFSNHVEINNDQQHYLSEETWITFHNSGSYSWKTNTSSEYQNRIPEKSFFIIGDKEAKIHVKGTVNGKVLVYSTGHIIIENDLLYACPPDKFSNSDDYLGLVSEKNVEIAHPSITGSGDLYIYAAIYAKRWFRIPNLHGNGKATLYIYGSVTAGSLTATEPRYATHIRFDKRLKTQRPPNFPVTESYEMMEWNREWKVNESELRKN